ncbi:hypothetical protein [Methanocaldococcus sp.]
MLNELKKFFIREIKEDKISKLPENFYNDVKEYIKNLEDEKERERALYFYRELRKIRIYKAIYGDRENLDDEERNILNLIENLEFKEKSEEEPKDIYISKNIQLVRAILNFPSFTDGKFIYSIEKNDILSLDEKIVKILEKHSIVKRFKVEL